MNELTTPKLDTPSQVSSKSYHLFDDLKPHEKEALDEIRNMQDGEVVKVIRIRTNNYKIKSSQKGRDKLGSVE